MPTIEIRRVLRAPPERVFDVLADHAGYARFPGVRSAKLLEPGALEPNGVGALREVDVGLAWFRERIVAFERPTKMEYRIIASSPPIDHELGRILYAPVEGGTEVIWTSTFRVMLPLIGGLAGTVAAWRLQSGFKGVLDETERLAAR